MHNYMEKQVFLKTENKVLIWCIIKLRSRSLVICQKLIYLKHYLMRQKGAIFLNYYVSKQVFSSPLKTLIFDAFIRGKAGFLMTCQKLQICCVFTWKSRLSHDVPKRVKFVALLRGAVNKCNISHNMVNVSHLRALWQSSRQRYIA